MTGAQVPSRRATATDERHFGSDVRWSASFPSTVRVSVQGIDNTKGSLTIAGASMDGTGLGLPMVKSRQESRG